ncbi:MAG: malate dehydrogenase [Myxococcales bacterium]|nr:malate dehydrogenase [Myxococcales bacterium]
MRKKITIVGAGNVGAALMAWAAAKDLGNLVLVDVVDGLPQGKALDLMAAAPLIRFDTKIVGTNDYRETADSDVIVITAGMARKPGMSRDDLLAANEEIMKSVVQEVTPLSPHAILIIVSNPLDAMCHVAKAVSGFPRERVIGMAGVLDSGRLRTFISWELGVSVEDISALVLGGHGDSMVPLIRYCSVGGVPLEQLISADRIAALIERTRNAGAEVVSLLKTGSAFNSPGAAALQMIEAIIKDEKRIMPCAAYLQGEYGHSGIYLGVPVLLGIGGMERIFELNLTYEEKLALDKSAAAVKELVVKLRYK